MSAKRPRCSEPLALGRPAPAVPSTVVIGGTIEVGVRATADGPVGAKPVGHGPTWLSTPGTSSAATIETIISSGSEVPDEPTFDSRDRDVSSDGVTIPGTPNSAVPEVELDITTATGRTVTADNRWRGPQLSVMPEGGSLSREVIYWGLLLSYEVVRTCVLC